MVNGKDVLTSLTLQLAAIDSQLNLQHQSNLDMQGIIEKMQQRLVAVKQPADNRLVDAQPADEPSANPPQP